MPETARRFEGLRRFVVHVSMGSEAAMNNVSESCQRWLWIVVALLVAPLAVRAGDAEPTFEKDIRPILKARCFQCHGEAGKREGGLDLRLRRLIVAGGESGTAVVPGKTDESYLLQRVRVGEMPPGEDAKKLSADEVAVIERWIAGGAATARPEPEAIPAGFIITPEDRQHWSFQPIVRPGVPQATHAQRVRNAVDAFLVERLAEHGQSFAPDADKRTLLRRACFDLIGLPPSPEEVDAFLADDSPDAYERLIDRLLASPHYGERWGRHWLDVAGYADSDGYSPRDIVRDHAFRYRDYVIRSFNDDKPFDQFVREQLAGDEMVPPPHQNLSAEQIDKLSATGFLLMAPSGISAGGDDPLLAYDDFTAEAIKIVSSSFLGLSVGCARCHDHRYDPISQEDYYRLRAVFEPAFAALRQRPPRQRLISLFTDADREKVKQMEAQAKELDELQQELLKPLFEEELARLPEEVRIEAREAYETPPAQRTQHHRRLLNRYRRLNVTAADLARRDPKAADEFQKLADKAAALRAARPQEGFLQALSEIPGNAPPTFLLGRGDPRQRKQAVTPADLSILRGDAPTATLPADDPALPTTGRRLAFAQHLTDGTHPLLARVLVNRVWMHHFGSGLCGAKPDFGLSGEEPSHPELLDWLAREFMDSGWRLKRLHRLIMVSTAYRQSLARNKELEQVDPENRLWGRRKGRRLEAEILRDAILAVSGKLNPALFGPPVPLMPDPAGEIVVGRENFNAGIPGPAIPLLGEEFRRGVYVQVRRSRPLTFMQTFDAPAMEPNCEARTASTVAPQSLLLMNNRFVVQQSRFFAERIRREAGPDTGDQVARAWKLALARAPDQDELADAVSLLTGLADHFRAHPPAPEPMPNASTSGNANNRRTPSPQRGPEMDPELAALAVLCQTLLSSNEFLYVD
jgi:hypothetical protein